MGLFRKLFGHRRRTPEPPKVTQTPTMTPLQNKTLDDLLSYASQNIKDPYKGFEPIAQEARSKYATETIPTLAQRFASAGGLGSSGFKGSLEQSGTDLERMLASMQSQFGNQRVSSLSGLVGLGATPRFENLVQMPQYQPRQSTGSSLGSLLGMGLGAGLGGLGPLGGFLGTGGGLSRMFRRF